MTRDGGGPEPDEGSGPPPSGHHAGHRRPGSARAPERAV